MNRNLSSILSEVFVIAISNESLSFVHLPFWVYFFCIHCNLYEPFRFQRF